MKISQELEQSLERAHDLAEGLRHEFISLEHLLHALTFDEDAGDALLNSGANLDELRDKLEEFLATEMPVLPAPAGAADEDAYDPAYSLGVQFVLQVAAAHVQSSGKNEVSGANVLVAMFREPESHAVYFLHEQKVTRFDVVRYLSHGISKLSEPAEDAPLSVDNEEEAPAPKNPLERFCTNLNERARVGKIDPLIGRGPEVERTIRILARRRKNNPVFVGDAGVGKTAIVEGLALKIVQGQVPEILKNVTIYALEMASLVAGTRFRGDFEERLKAVVDAVKDQPNVVLFVDEIHNMIGAGAASGGTMDASNLLKPALANGQVRCIGSTTFKEYRQIFEKDHALARRFQKIEIGEPSIDETVQILHGLQSHYESFHGVSYSPAALRAAVELSAKHINDRFLPDKAIDIMDEAGAEVKLRHNGGLAKANDKPAKVAARDVELVVARIAKVPNETVRKDDKERLATLERDLKLLIYAQDQAVEQVVRAIQLGRAGLGEPTQPIGSFLFAGPTGVGKTELAKQLAKQLGIGFIRFDMSEYQEKHTVSRLIGSPPGYVGFDQGGQLTEAVIRTPHCVLLLDEIEKAHPDIFQILLQVMDHATLTDNNGRKADFRQAIVIMTTNAGAFAMTANPIGFAAEAKASQQSMKAVEQTFSPEFRNRLTAIIPFAPLDERVAERIVEKMVGELEQRLASKRVELLLEPSARSYLAKKGYDKAYGARPIKRLVESEVSHALSTEILFGKLSKGGRVRISASDGKLLLDVTPRQ